MKCLAFFIKIVKVSLAEQLQTIIYLYFILLLLCSEKIVKNGGSRYSNFQAAMWNAYRGSQCYNSVCEVGEDSQNCSFDCAGAPDITPPSVSLTAPLSGAIVSGVVGVSASAFDDVGVVGVRFLLDGNNLGVEDTNAPFSVDGGIT